MILELNIHQHFNRISELITSKKSNYYELESLKDMIETFDINFRNKALTSLLKEKVKINYKTI